MTDQAVADWIAGLPDHLADIVTRGAARWPDQIALYEPDGPALTYGDLAVAVAAAVPVLRAAGIGAGDRVVILNENSVEAVIVLFAVSRLNAWPILLNARVSAREVEEIARHAGARCLLATDRPSADAAAHAAHWQGRADTLGLGPGQKQALALPGTGLSVQIAPGPVDRPQPEPVQGDPTRDVAVMIYTSGTTGAPKGVMLSHRAALYVASSPGSQKPATPDDHIYDVLPMSHIFGLTSTLLRGLYGGARLRLMARFDAADLAGALATAGITILQGVPAMYARLLEQADQSGVPLSAPDLQVATVGGANLEPDLKVRVEDALGLRLVNGYGMTEMASTVSRSLPHHIGRDVSAGAVLPGIAMRFVDEQGQDVPDGDAGELWLRGPNRMLGYYRNPDATAAVLTADGWYRTGDLARRDADGCLRFVERQREVIIHSGFNIYPAEVEGELVAHPDITLAAVVGRARDGDEDVIAFVQPVPGRAPDVAALQDWLRGRLAGYKVPRAIVVMDLLPATAAGKILKKQLRDLAAALPEKGVGPEEGPEEGGGPEQDAAKAGTDDKA